MYLLFGDLDKNYAQIIRSYHIFNIINYKFLFYKNSKYLFTPKLFKSIFNILVFISYLSILSIICNYFKIIFIVIKKLKKKISYDLLFKIFLVILIISFFCPLIFYDSVIISDFYSVFSRLWQFFLGSIVFLILNIKKTRIFKIFNNFNFIPISLTILFLWQVFLYKFGFYITSIITSTCTSLILLSLNKKFTNILLNLKFLIFSGKISFPLILFHMPIIYFLNLFIINKLAVVILTFLLSYFFSILIFKIKIKLTSVGI